MAAVVAGRPRRIFRLAPGLLTIKGRQGENRGQRPVARPPTPAFARPPGPSEFGAVEPDTTLDPGLAGR